MEDFIVPTSRLMQLLYDPRAHCISPSHIALVEYVFNSTFWLLADGKIYEVNDSLSFALYQVLEIYYGLNKYILNEMVNFNIILSINYASVMFK